MFTKRMECQCPQNIHTSESKENFFGKGRTCWQIEFISIMSSEEMKEEICKVFAAPMGLTPEIIDLGQTFPFTCRGLVQDQGIASKTVGVANEASLWFSSILFKLLSACFC